MDKPIKLIDPEIHTSTWIPFGKSNMEALNRFVGSHKRYTTPTEFGGKGEVRNMISGSFSLEKHGVFLTPEDYGFTDFLHAQVKESFDSEKIYGLSIYKNGLSGLGMKLPGAFSTKQIKFMTGKLAYKIADCIFPVLNEQQEALISTILQIDDLSNSQHKVQTYSTIIAECENDLGANSDEIFEKHAHSVEAITDWITAHATIGGCHIFVGMSATLCLGRADESVRRTLRYIQFLQSSNKISHHLHAMLWSMRKQVHLYRSKIKNGSYTILHRKNDKICRLNSNLLRLKVFDDYLRKETASMSEIWNDFDLSDRDFHKRILHSFKDETEKTVERNSTIEQLTEELSVLTSELENKLDLIMTRDSTTLNIILLVLTVVSVLGVAEVVGFSKDQWEVVSIVFIPFALASFVYIRSFLKNFLRQK